MRITGMFLVSALLAAGCASTPADNPEAAGNAVAAQPTFTQEEKDQMSTDEKVAIHNASADADEQIVCRRQVITGSHRKKMVCRTSAQIKQDQDEARESLRDTMRGTASGDSN